jgi:hypothetical protein
VKLNRSIFKRKDDASSAKNKDTWPVNAQRGINHVPKRSTFDPDLQ